MNANGIFRRRHLPHWDVEGHPFFVTACLEGSIPAQGWLQLDRYRKQLDSQPCPRSMDREQWNCRKDKLLFAQFDEWLDRRSVVRHLGDERQAQIVRDAFLHFAGIRYDLYAFVVMPSHHHWLFLPKEEWARAAVARRCAARGSRPTAREIISHSIQSYTATMCNRVRGATGPYWQNEAFDHWARDEAETMRIINYIERNPETAGLVQRPEDWPFSSAQFRAARGIPRGQPLVLGEVS